jgi:hypothetical protein
MATFVSLDATEVTVETAGLEGLATVKCYSAKTQADIPDSVEEADVVAVSRIIACESVSHNNGCVRSGTQYGWTKHSSSALRRRSASYGWE